MDVLYDVIESVHVFIPIIAVVSLVLIVFLCGIGRPQNPPQDYLSKIQEFDKASKYSKAKQPKPSKPIKPASPNSINSSSKPIAYAKEESTQESSVRQRKSRPVGVTRKSNDEPENEVIHEGEWVTVNPKRKARSKDGGNDSDETESSWTKKGPFPNNKPHKLCEETSSPVESVIESVIEASESVIEANESVIEANESVIEANESVIEPDESVIEASESAQIEMKRSEDVRDLPAPENEKSPSFQRKNSPKTESKNCSQGEDAWSSPSSSKKRNRKRKSPRPAFIIEDPVFPSASEAHEAEDEVDIEKDTEVITHDEDDVVVVDTIEEDDIHSEEKRKKKKKKNKQSKNETKENEEAEYEDDTPLSVDDSPIAPLEDDSGFTIKQKKKRPRRE